MTEKVKGHAVTKENGKKVQDEEVEDTVLTDEEVYEKYGVGYNIKE